MEQTPTDSSEARPRRRLRVRWLRVFGVCLLMAGVAVAGVRADPLYEQPAVEIALPPRESGSVRLMTLNCAHGRATAFNQLLTREVHIRRNLDAIAELIRLAEPDVVALQELDAPSSWSGGFDHLAYLAEKTGYPYRFHGLHVNRSSFPKLAYGTGVLSRFPLTQTKNHAFGTNVLDTKGFVYVEVEAPNMRFGFVSVHLDFKRDSERRSQLAQLDAFLKGDADRLLVVSGDFNTNVGADGGVLREFADGLNLRSLGEPLRTFPSKTPKRWLDDFLLSAGIEGGDKRAINLLVSDHLPVVTDIRPAAK